MEQNIEEVVAAPKGKVTSHKSYAVAVDKLDPSVAFNLGWDAYASGFSLVGWIKKYSDIKKGWEAASRKQVAKPSTEPDRYVRKCLKLRFQAWTRNKAFNLSITPDFLRQIDVEVCPVTLEKLTHGTFGPTDWSIDRINSKGGYAITNLAIISTRANLAKANYSYHKIHGFAHNPDAPIPTELYQGEMVVDALYESGSGTNSLVFTYYSESKPVTPEEIKAAVYNLHTPNGKARIVDTKVSVDADDKKSITVEVTFDEVVTADSSTKLPVSIQGKALKPLTRVEWARLAVICSHGPSSQEADGTINLPEKVVPCVSLPPPCVMPVAANLLQMAITYKAHTSLTGSSSPYVKAMGHFADQVIGSLTHEQKKEINKLIGRAKKVTYSHVEPTTMWFNTTLFGYFLEFYREISKEGREAVIKNLGPKHLSSTSFLASEHIHLDTEGRVK